MQFHYFLGPELTLKEIDFHHWQKNSIMADDKL